MSNNFGLKIGVEGEREFKKSLSDINQTFKVLGSEMKLVSSQFDKNDQSVQALAARNAVLNKEIDTQKQKIETLRSALENAAKSFGENDRRTQNWQVQLNNAEAALNDMERELNQNNTALEKAADEFDDAEKQADEFGDEVEDAGKQSKDAGSKFDKLGGVLKGIGAALAAAVVAIGVAVGTAAGKINECIDIYASFEDSMLTVAATMGITAKEIANGSKSYDMLTAAAKEAGASTRYSASEAGEALNYLALAGYDAEKACETLPKVLNLAAAGGMELATTSDLVTDAMSALQMETSDLDVFIDQLAKTSQKSNTSVQQLGEAILVCAGTATSTGQELTTLNTALGVLADNGIKGAEGGTKLRNVMLSLSSPTDKAATELDALGVSVFDAKGNMRQLDEIMADLNRSLDSLSQEGRTYAISAIFNKADISAVNALLASTSGRFDELSKQIDNCAGAADSMANTMEAGLAGTTRSFSSAMEGMKIEVGGIFADFKQTLMSDSIEVIRSFTGNLQEAGGNWAKIGEAIGQGLSDMIDLISSYLPQVVEMGMQIITMLGGALMDNIGILVEAAASIVLTLLEGVISALPALAEGAVQLVLALVNGIIANLPMLGEAAIQLIAALVSGIGSALPQLIPASVQAVITIVEGLISNMPFILDAALQLIIGLTQGILDAIPVLIAALPDVINSIVTFLLDSIPEIIQTGIQLLTSLVAALPKIIKAIVAAIPEIVNGIVDAVIGSIPLIIQAGIDLLISLIRALPEIITTIVGAIPEIIGGIINAVLGNIDKIITAGVQLFVALIEELPKIIKEIVKAVPKIVTGIVKAFKDKMGDIVDIGENIVKGLWQGIQSLASWLWKKVSKWISGIWDGICDFFGIHSPSREMAWVGEMLVKGLAGSIDKNGDEAVSAAEGMAADINGVMQGIASDIGADYAARLQISADSIDTGSFSRTRSDGGSIGTIVALLEEYLPRLNDYKIVTDTGAVVGWLAPAMDEELGIIKIRKERYSV